MTANSKEKNLELLLVEQVKQLDRMEKLETRRLAILNSDKPELALNLQKESDAIFNRSVSLQEKIDILLKSVKLEALPKEQQKRIQSLTKLVRKLARRNYELNQQSQKVLNELLSGISEQLSGLKKGRQAVRSYHGNPSSGGSTLSGQI